MHEDLLKDVKMLVDRYEIIYQENPDNNHIKVYLDSLKTKLKELTDEGNVQ